MKIKKAAAVIGLGVVLSLFFGSTFHLQAQTVLYPRSSPTNSFLREFAGAPDILENITNILDTPAPTNNPTPAMNIVRMPPGIYLSLQGLMGAGTGPLPGSPFGTNVPVYEIGSNIFAFDDRGVDYPTLNAQLAGQSSSGAALTSDGMMMTMDGSGMDTPSGTDYGTNLWILVPTNAITASDQFNVILTNTIPGQPYDVLVKETLTDPEWSVEVPSAYAETNFIPVQLWRNGRTNLFVSARFAGDSTGNGIPDWWLLMYFGTTMVDVYALDSSGDGWTLLQDYQNGFVPGTFNTPPPPRITSAVLDSTATYVTLTWISGGGPVTNYVVKDFYGVYGSVVITNVAPDTFSATVPIPDDGFGLVYDYQNGNQDFEPEFEIGADFSDGSHADSDPVAVTHLTLTLNAQIVRGTGGQPYLAVMLPPPGLSFIRFCWFTNNYITGYEDFQHADLSATNLVNSLMPIPANVWQAYLNAFAPIQLKAFTTNGAFGPYQTLYGAQLADEEFTAPFYSFVDARTNLAANLKFLLRAATITEPFSYGSTVPWGNYDVFQRSSSSSSYEYYGFHYFSSQYASQYGYSVIDELRPVQEGFLWRNFIFNDGDLNNGNFSTGASHSLNWDNQGNYLGFTHTLNNPKYQYSGSGDETPLPQAITNLTWIYDYNIASGDTMLRTDLGLSLNGGNLYLAADARNVYGLGFDSLHFKSGSEYQTLAAGANTASVDPITAFMELDPPVLSTLDYYFCSQTPYFNYIYYPQYAGLPQPMPGSPAFVPGTPSPLLITSMGQLITVSGWARQVILDGYPGKYGYLEQYFDQAYTMDSSGNITTNSAGLLSPYGEFYPTQPGPAALVTMPDIDTGQRGTGVVHVAKIQLDRNNDGVMDLSFAGPDNTSYPNPMKFWVDSDHDAPADSGNPLDHNVNAPTLPDYAANRIICQRELENFARLWICGLPSLPSAQGYTVTLSCNAISGTPAINLYAVESNGGIGYLTDTNVAQSLVGQSKLQTISPTSTYIFPSSYFDGTNKYFLFQGAGIGEGEFVLTIYQSTNIVAQTSAYIDLHDIRDLYEQTVVTNVIQTWPEMVQQSATSGFRVLSSPPENSFEASQLAVFVHGWRMTEFDWNSFSQTMFKRLYWQGFQGRFASLRWPTRSADTDTNGLDLLTYNRSEHIAFDSGSGAALYLYDLRQRFTNYTISVCAHSQGNILMMEALKELADANQAPLDNYVMMQAAVPAHCYDTTITNLPSLMDAEASIPTPNTYSNYADRITSALRTNGKIVNFFNTYDYALATASVDVLGTPVNVSWEGNESSLVLKPLLFFGYSYIATNGLAIVTTNQYTAGSGITNLQTRIVTDPLELMPFVARPRSKAVGAQAAVGAIVNGGEVDLAAFGFSRADYDHSGEFNRNIQTSQVQQFYPHLIRALTQGLP